MKSRTVLKLFEYWNGRREGMAAPARTAIEPADIRDVLRETFILHAPTSQGELTFRLAGSALSDLFGRELRDTRFRALMPASHAPLFGRLLRNSIHDSAVVLLTLRGASKGGRTTGLELILLPLRHEDGAPRILGGLSPISPAFWYGLDPISTLELDAVRVVDPDREPLFLANRPEVRLPPDLMPKEAEIGSLPPRGPNLRLIPGGLSDRGAK